MLHLDCILRGTMRMKPLRPSAVIVVVAAFASFAIYSGCRSKAGSMAMVKDAIPDAPQYAKTVLKMKANPRTGIIYVAFDPRPTGLASGTQVDIQWDVLQSNRDVKCSELKRHETVTIADSQKIVGLRLKVDPSILKNSLATAASTAPIDDEKMTKYGPHGIHGFKGETVVQGCLVMPGKGAVAQTSAMPDATGTGSGDGSALSLADDSGDDLSLPVGLRYGERCSQAIGYFKPFSCVDDGRTVPITVDGVEQTNFVDKCDRPQYLPIGSTQCATYTRVGRLKLYTDKTYTKERTDSTAVFFCRHYEDTATFTPIEDRVGPTYPYFHDVAVVEQNKPTGKTCFLQALGGGRGQGEKDEDLFGMRVPPPTETNEEFAAATTAEQKTKGAQPAWGDAGFGGFWLAPANIGQIHCISCHDSDPFMHSPWIDQMKVLDASGKPTDELLVPSNPDGPYSIIGADIEEFMAWDTSYSVKTADAGCESCHRIGSMGTCRDWSRDAFPLHDEGTEAANSEYYDLNSKDEWATKHPNHHWMPPPTDDADWASSLETYKTSAQQLRQCCTLKKGFKRLLSYGQINSPSSHRLSAADLSYLQSKGCMVTPLTQVLSK